MILYTQIKNSLPSLSCNFLLLCYRIEHRSVQIDNPVSLINHTLTCLKGPITHFIFTDFVLLLNIHAIVLDYRIYYFMLAQVFISCPIYLNFYNGGMGLHWLPGNKGLNMKKIRSKKAEGFTV